MKELLKELEAISKRMDEIAEASVIAVTSVDFWTGKSEIIFKKMERLENEYIANEEEQTINEARFLVRRVDIEIEVLAKLDSEQKSLSKRKSKILKILKA